VAANLLGQRPVGRAAEELEPLVLAQIAAPLALGSRFGLLRFGSRIRAAACAASLAAGSLPAPSIFGPFCLSSAVTVTVSTSISEFTSKLVGFGCFSGVSGCFKRTWLGDQDSNLDKCLQRALSYH
jgi:hypothetical protein